MGRATAGPQGLPSPARRALIASAASAGVVALLLLVAWAAVVGPDVLVRGGRRARGTAPPPNPLDTGTASATARAGPEKEFEPGDHWLLTLLLAVVLLILAVVVVAALVVLVRALWTSLPRRHRQSPGIKVEFDVLSVPAVVQELTRVSVAQHEDLSAGTPRNGIVTCWHRFEVAGERGGLSRQPWETPAEFALRVLDLAGVDHGAVAELAGLYREARFSSHEMGERERQRALAALDAVHRSLNREQVGGER